MDSIDARLKVQIILTNSRRGTQRPPNARGEQMIVRGEYTGPIPEYGQIMNRVMQDQTRLRALAPT